MKCFQINYAVDLLGTVEVWAETEEEAREEVEEMGDSKLFSNSYSDTRPFILNVKVVEEG